MKKSLAALLFCTIIFSGCNQAPTNLTGLSIPSKPQENSEILNLPNPEVTQITHDQEWSDRPTIYQDTIAWEEIKYIGGEEASKIFIQKGSSPIDQVPRTDGSSQTNPLIIDDSLIYDEVADVTSRIQHILKIYNLNSKTISTLGEYWIDANMGNKNLILQNRDGYSIFNLESQDIKEIPSSAFDKFFGIYWIPNNTNELYFITRDKNNPDSKLSEITKQNLALYKFNPTDYSSTKIGAEFTPQHDSFFYSIRNNLLYLGLYNEKTERQEFFTYNLETKENTPLFNLPFKRYSSSIENFEVSDNLIMLTWEPGYTITSTTGHKDTVIAYDIKNNKLYNVLGNTNIKLAIMGNFLTTVLQSYAQSHLNGNEIVISATEQDPNAGAKTLEIMKITVK